MKHSDLLIRINNTIKQLRKDARKVAAVFDIDSTLYDVGPRLEQILIDYARDPEKQKLFPDLVPKLQNIRVLRQDWGIFNALERVGLDGHHQEFQKDILQWWKERFFSNDYIHFDQAYPGSVDYVNLLHSNGADIFYLTGRDQDRMGRQSPVVLKQSGFPLNETSAQLILKPHKSMDDARFKTDWFHQIESNNYAKIYFFENEPVNINLLRKELPHIEIIFFDSTHSKKEEAPLDIPQIMDYLCHLHKD